ncbi:MAG TPA: transglutaminase-like domain-containing protein, partial [Syntrophomonadaceae bacterium]|nr:transglutaminase-like domain-containing protein [Syntrophomonadaceae bacterium]
AFVQSFPYVSDSISTPSDEYPRYPVETLLQKEGDCEDTAILTAVLLNELGYGSALLYLPDQGHMAVGILGNENVEGSYYEKDGQRYYYLETTAVGWHIGEIPDDCQDADAMVFPLP